MNTILNHLILAEEHLQNLKKELKLATNLLPIEDVSAMKTKLAALTQSQKTAQSELDLRKSNFLKTLFTLNSFMGEQTYHLTNLGYKIIMHTPNNFTLKNANSSASESFEGLLARIEWSPEKFNGLCMYVLERIERYIKNSPAILEALDKNRNEFNVLLKKFNEVNSSLLAVVN